MSAGTAAATITLAFLFPATLSPAFARTRLALFHAAAGLPIHGRSGAAFRFFLRSAALFVTFFDVFSLSFLFPGVFRFASSCHNFSLCCAFRRAARRWIYRALVIRALTPRSASFFSI
jgi:hypothetical protein